MTDVVVVVAHGVPGVEVSQSERKQRIPEEPGSMMFLRGMIDC